jgi:hypothetical protein
MKLSWDQPYAYLSEREPFLDAGGAVRRANVATIFLTASRCPIGCAMCDLHHNTFDAATPRGAIVRQIDFALSRLTPVQSGEEPRWVKLYNSGNFFDAASIPPSDWDRIARQCRGFQRVIVENHPRFGRSKHRVFRDYLAGKLEIAVGLETVQPRWLKRLEKQMTRDDFDAYAAFLKSLGLDLRVFLIVGVPGATVTEAVRWARLSVRHAIAAGARHISLIPARSGHGWNGHADQLPRISLGCLAELFAACLEDAAGRVVISVDLWGFQSETLGKSDRIAMERLRRAVETQEAREL